MTAELSLHNGDAISLATIPVLPVPQFRTTVIDAVREGARVAALFGARHDRGVRLYAILACGNTGLLSVISSDVHGSYPALTPDCEQAHIFECEIAEQWGIVPDGHPWLKPVRFTCTQAGGTKRTASSPCGLADFFSIAGDEIHEVGVGPVHAGIIEPGHFRFQCHGETVFHLEISLGYQHRGIERALSGGPDRRTIHYMETLAGDTTVGHTTAYCRVAEALAGARIPARAQVIRGIALELERMANHVGDLGALAGDIGYLPTSSYCGRIRGDILNTTAELCGNRFGRGLLRCGGVGCDMTADVVQRVEKKVRQALRDATGAVGLLWEEPSVLARFERTGTVTAELATRIGLVGVAARASGINMDVRRDFPYGSSGSDRIPVATARTGDVFARAWVRWLEVQRSAAFVLDQLPALPTGEVLTTPGEPQPGRLCVALVEGWRGEICHVAITDDRGRLGRYKVVDPSFHNWFGLACAMRNQEISDFPLCNKSFNLSYCGHDL